MLENAHRKYFFPLRKCAKGLLQYRNAFYWRVHLHFNDVEIFVFIFVKYLTWNLEIKGSSFTRHVLIMIREGISLQSTFIWTQSSILVFFAMQWNRVASNQFTYLWFWMFSFLVFPWHIFESHFAVFLSLYVSSLSPLRFYFVGYGRFEPTTVRHTT